MSDFIYYLEKNGFYPRREDTESIIRRVDHDGDRHINYDEFSELVGGLSEARPAEEAEGGEKVVEETKEEEEVVVKVNEKQEILGDEVEHVHITTPGTIEIK